MKHANKDMALQAKAILEAQLLGLSFIKVVEIDEDDHGFFTTTKIKSRREYKASKIDIPSIVEIDGFKLKNCIVMLG